MNATVRRLTKDTLRYSCQLAKNGWAPASSGNVSVMIQETRQILIKKTGGCLLGSTPDDFLLLNIDGSVAKGQGKPTKEVRFHLGIYKIRDDIKAVIHSHPPYASAYAIAGISPPLLTPPSKAVIRSLPFIAFSPPGSEELANDVVGVFKDPNIKAALLGGHGVVVGGQTIHDAYNLTEWLEDAAREAFLVSLIRK